MLNLQTLLFITKILKSVSYTVASLALIALIPLFPHAINPSDSLMKSIVFAYLLNILLFFYFRKDISMRQDRHKLKKLMNAIGITLFSLFLVQFIFILSLDFYKNLISYSSFWEVVRIAGGLAVTLFASLYSPFIFYYIEKYLTKVQHMNSSKKGMLSNDMTFIKNIVGVFRIIFYILGAYFFSILLFLLPYALDPYDYMFKLTSVAYFLNIIHFLIFSLQTKEKSILELKRKIRISLHFTLIQYFFHAILYLIITYEPIISISEIGSSIYTLEGVVIGLPLIFYLPLTFFFLNAYLKKT